MICNLCPHNCNTDRQTKLGVCLAPADFKISHMQLHHWEEPCISGTNGSGTIFFSHCNLKCVFCQNYDISQQAYGKIISQEEFIKLCIRLKEQGAHNLNLVSPTCYSSLLIKVLPKVKEKINLPIIWNSNAYEKVETLKQLDGLIDVYLPDFKYFDNSLAVKYSQAPNYYTHALVAIKEMVKQVGAVELDKNGLIKKGVLIRHLVLPGQIEDSKNVLKTIKDNFGKKVWVSLMSQYYPAHKANSYSEINRILSENEYNKIKDYYEILNFANGYFQELNFASSQFTPDFKIETLA
ncbi:MAG: radical SAM protein [Candidatus Parcubacteria bacterium]|nr:radical SAM protein [Candidatus Parcubacteria bacterium]